jgi:hypothetical protein
MRRRAQGKFPGSLKKAENFKKIKNTLKEKYKYIKINDGVLLDFQSQAGFIPLAAGARVPR